MELSYYPGCTIKTSARNYETSAKAALAWLNAHLNEMEDWTCCGVVHPLAQDDLYHQLAPIRVLNHMQHQEQQREVVTLCDMCYNTLSQANVAMQQHGDRLKTINTYIHDTQAEPDYAGSITVLHLLQVLRDKIGFATIQKQVGNPLKGLKVFPYYGCMVLRPGEISIDSPEDPQIIGDLMRALGATVIDDPVKNECCGSYHTVDQREVVYSRITHIVERAQARGAEAIVLSCPLCRFNLDTRQGEAPGIANPLPVFYYTQLMGLAFGLGAEELGLEDHAHAIAPQGIVQRYSQQR
jgi:heterodisulfide reductase subunit B